MSVDDIQFIEVISHPSYSCKIHISGLCIKIVMQVFADIYIHYFYDWKRALNENNKRHLQNYFIF